MERYSTTFISDMAAGFIKRRESEDKAPWLALIAPAAPHAPYDVEPKYANASVPKLRLNPAMRERDLSDKLPNRPPVDDVMAEARRLRRLQLLTLRSVDDMVGRLSGLLLDLGEDRRTLAIFMSDNGFLWGEHGLVKAYTAKGNPYLRSIEIPLMVRWPAFLEGERVDPRRAANIDIAPTILDASGEKIPASMDGRSLLRRWERGHILLEYWRKRGASTAALPDWSSILARAYQYVEYREDGEIIFREYYDLDRDPYQLRNLLQDGVRANDPDVSKLHERLSSMRQCKGKRCP